MEAKVMFPGLDQSLPALRPECFPCRTVLEDGVGTIPVERQQGGFQASGATGMGEKVALPTAGRGGIHDSGE
jgi:hypothetical protein